MDRNHIDRGRRRGASRRSGIYTRRVLKCSWLWNFILCDRVRIIKVFSDETPEQVRSKMSCPRQDGLSAGARRLRAAFSVGAGNAFGGRAIFLEAEKSIRHAGRRSALRRGSKTGAQTLPGLVDRKERRQRLPVHVTPSLAGKGVVHVT